LFSTFLKKRFSDVVTEKSFWIQTFLQKGLAGLGAAPHASAFLFCELTSKARKRAFFFAPIVAKEKSEIK
jgi:hypothetical protein